MKRSAILPKLNARGVAHHLVLAIIVVGIAIGGSYTLVRSFADSSSKPSGGSTGGTSSYSYGTSLYDTTIGTVAACKTGSTLYMKVTSAPTTATRSLLYWFDYMVGEKNTRITPGSTTYVKASVRGTYIHAEVNTGVWMSTDATFPVSNIVNC